MSSAIAYGDFNGVGKLDVVFAEGNQNQLPSHLEVKLANGDGTFRLGSRFGSFQYDCVTQIAVGDFNGDGKLDLAVVEGVGYSSVSVFLGNGDGTFQHPKEYAMHYGPFAAVTGDFNGDGKLDLVFGAFRNNTYGSFILIGNGDGTFQKPRRITATPRSDGGCGSPLLVNDFNGDGNLDLAFCERYRIGVVLGKGNGTFEKPAFYRVLAKGFNGTFSFTASDFNSDGKTDLVASYPLANFTDRFAVFLGNGDGTFQHHQVVPGVRDNGELGIVTGDFNSDGLLDFVLEFPNEISAAVYLQK